MTEPRDILLQLYAAALAAVEPGAAVRRALAGRGEPAERTWVLALGKAAQPMARAAVAHLREFGLVPAGGVVVGSEPGAEPAPGIAVVAGDHPLPGPGSLAAAEALEDVVRTVLPGDDVWILLSGGTTSLVAAPVHGISAADLRATYAALLESGLDIHEMNRVRKRISRWGGGRLAAALAHARVGVFAISDVVGDDIASIGSGPCAPDSSTADRVLARLVAAGADAALPRSVLDLLDRTARGLAPETPKPGDPLFRGVETRIVAGNRVAVEAAADEALRRGLRVRVRRRPIAGEAAQSGAAIVRRLLAIAEGTAGHAPDLTDAAPSRTTCWLAGGETTVTIRGPAGTGGRCQELALSAARLLAGVSGYHVSLLAAGTDGRDGPTDAAGAVVDNDTWGRIRAAGRDPAADLEAHDAYASLDAADALVRTGLTGTNVADLVIVLCR